MIYIAVYGALLLVHLLSFDSPPLRRALFPVVAIFLFCFAAFRYEVGCDWSGYELNYEASWYLTPAEAVNRREPGYWLLLTQVHSFELEYPYLNVLMAIPFFWGLARFAANDPDPLAIMILAFPVLIINLPMSGIRQGAAVGFICLAFIAFRKRQLVAYVVSVLTASALHASAVVFLVLAPFVKFRVTWKTILISGIIVLPIAYLMLIETIEFYSDRYVGSGVDSVGAVYRSGMLATVGGYFMLSLRRAFQKRFPTDYPLALIGSWVMLATFVLVPISSVISDRFGYYVTPIQLMIMARIPYLVGGRDRMLFSAAPYMALGLVITVWIAFSSLFALCYLPYQTWLDWHY